MSVFFHFSFPGGGGLFPLLLGKAIAMRKFFRSKVPGAQFLYSGVSSGSFVALLMALELTEEEIHLFAQRFLIEPVQKKWYLVEQFHVWYFLKRNIRTLIGSDGYKKLKNIYRVGISQWNHGKFETRIIDRFQNSEEVVNAILVSSHIAILGRQPFRLFEGKLALDGGLTCDHVQTQDLPLSIQKQTMTFRIGYESFPKHLLHFQQAMPLFTPEKWQRMYEEGEHSFHAQAMEQWLQPFFIISKQTPSILCFQLKSFSSQQQQQQEPRPPSSPKQYSALRGLTTGWIEIIGGYTVWGLLFVWRFVLHNPF